MLNSKSLSHIIQTLLFSLLALLATPTQASPFLGSGILEGLESLLGAANSSLAAGLSAFLGDHRTVVFQNGLRDETMNSTGEGKVCPRMSVIFARGTGEPGLFIHLPCIFI